MEQCITAVLAAVPTVDSTTTYETILESISVEFRSALPNALKQLKREGQIQKYIDVVDGVNVHVIKRLAV